MHRIISEIYLAWFLQIERNANLDWPGVLAAGRNGPSVTER